ncbi:hypothetical protein FQR65_LT13402 [Abscondita terminalis]|nr:hypothetical protein FQR65_LT13402 [Abscondita terminalis]
MYLDIKLIAKDTRMSDVVLIHYLQSMDNYWKNQDGQVLAILVSLRHEHVINKDLMLEHPESMVERFIASPFNEIIVCHLKCVNAFNNGSYLEAFEFQSILVKSLRKIIKNQRNQNWALPLFYSVCLDLRLLAQRVEKEGNVVEKSGEILEKAAACLLRCLYACTVDHLSSEENTKQIGVLTIVNQLFEIYLRINKLHLYMPLIKTIESSPFKNSFPLSQQITYRYLVGRKAMFEGDLSVANQNLTYAFENCHKVTKKNKQLILISLVPVKMRIGFLPNRLVLEKYDVLQFWELIQAIRQGNLRLFDEIMTRHETFFNKFGIYLIVKKLKMIVYRNLFRKVYLILNTNQIPFQALQSALVYSTQTDVDLEEPESIVNNLIFDRKINAYISTQDRKVVVSKQNPFPSLIKFC